MQMILESMVIYQVIPSSKLTADWLQISLKSNRKKQYIYM